MCTHTVAWLSCDCAHAGKDGFAMTNGVRTFTAQGQLKNTLGFEGPLLAEIVLSGMACEAFYLVVHRSVD